MGHALALALARPTRAVLRVADNSPAAAAGIEPFFDYLVGVNGEALSPASMQGSATGSVEEMLAGVVDAHEDRELNLQVWSSKRAELRGGCTQDAPPCSRDAKETR